MSRVKIVGYAKKEFFNNGIEYRNFSPDLVGNQFASDNGTPVFTLGNFNISTNLDDKINKNFTTNNFSNFVCLEGLNIDEVFESIIATYSKKAKLNLDYDDVLTYAFFGSLREFIRVSLENIIIKWPASLYVSDVSPSDASNTGTTITNYSFNTITNTSTFDVNVNRIENPYEINFLSGGTIIGTFNETNPLRNLQLNFNYYEVNNEYGDFNVIGFTGSSNLTTSTITIQTEGNPFPNSNTENINYHIRPNVLKREEFFLSLNEFENNLLNRLSIPIYTSSFKVFPESSNGTTVQSIKKLTWPLRDGYNIDFNSIEYSAFVNELLEIADNSDTLKSNLMVRFLVSSSISEFDSIPDINGNYQDTNGQKMTSALKIYGREFDEIKKYSDGIKFANVVTYDKKNNTPDIVIKKLARVLGWQLTSSISEIDVLSNFLSLNNNYYEGYSRGLSDAEAEVELWRRIVLNTPWIWKSKGTRKAIEFLFKFIGAPDGLVTFNEYLYVADQQLNPNLISELMQYFNNTSDTSGLNVDSEGFPLVQPNTPEMYFQKAGLWYRETGGPNPDIDILEGNNPHIGPYDGGQAYIDQFSNCLIPNFSGGTSEDLNIEGETNLFTNYGNGTFDECCDGNVYVTITTDLDFSGITSNNINNVINNFPIRETGCTFTNVWTMIADINGDVIYNEPFFTGVTESGVTISSLSEIEFIQEIYKLSGTTELSGTTFNSYDGKLDVILPIGCNNELLDKYLKIELCVDTEYNCIEEGVGSSNLTSFLIPIKASNPCSNTILQVLSQTLYHNGSGALPAIGDTVFIDEQGVTPFVTLSGESTAYYLGGDLADPNNYLLTDSNGVRIEIICPEIDCNIITGIQNIGTTGGFPSYIFYVEGVIVPRTINILFTLENVQKASPLDNVIVTFNENFATPTDVTESSPLNVTLQITPNGGFLSNFDYDSSFTARYTSGVTAFTVKMEVLSIEGECFNGPRIREYNYNT